MKLPATLLFFFAVSFSVAAQNAPAAPSLRDSKVDSIYLFRQIGGRVDWMPDSSGKRILFDALGSDGYYDVYRVDADGNNFHCLTDNKALPGRHQGQPAWHPGGQWFVFQAEKSVHPGTSRFATPGRGVFNDLWLGRADGQQFFQLTDLPADKNHGVLHPHFSPDGKKLSWCEMYGKAWAKEKGYVFGQFKLKVADFSFGANGKPQLTNIREYVPGDSVFYENHGFSPDGNYLLFSSNFYLKVSPLKNNKLYRLNLATGKTELLADKGYNEHATYTPGGKYIVWGTNMGKARNGMDYWIMKADGTEKQRFTGFNERGYPEHRKKVYAVDMSFSPDGKYLLAYVQNNAVADMGIMYMIKMKEPIDK